MNVRGPFKGGNPASLAGRPASQQAGARRVGRLSTGDIKSKEPSPPRQANSIPRAEGGGRGAAVYLPDYWRKRCSLAAYLLSGPPIRLGAAFFINQRSISKSVSVAIIARSISVNDWSNNSASCVSIVQVLPHRNLKDPGREKDAMLEATHPGFNLYPNPGCGAGILNSPR